MAVLSRAENEVLRKFHNHWKSGSLNSLRRRLLLGPSPCWKSLLNSAFTFKTPLLRHYAKQAFKQGKLTLCHQRKDQNQQAGWILANQILVGAFPRITRLRGPIFCKWLSVKMTFEFDFLWSTLFWLEESILTVSSDCLRGVAEADNMLWSNLKHIWFGLRGRLNYSP